MIDLLEKQISGLEARLKELQDVEKRFIKAQGLSETYEKARADQELAGVDLQAAKEEYSDLQAQKRQALRSVAEAISAKMSQALPEGRAALEISEDGVFIGWEKPDGARVPYAGLSGGQKVTYDQALCYALLGEGEKILILEAAELDPMRLQATMGRLAVTDDKTQVILNTWAGPAEASPAWNIVKIGGTP